MIVIQPRLKIGRRVAVAAQIEEIILGGHFAGVCMGVLGSWEHPVEIGGFGPPPANDSRRGQRFEQVNHAIHFIGKPGSNRIGTTIWPLFWAQISVMRVCDWL